MIKSLDCFTGSQCLIVRDATANILGEFEVSLEAFHKRASSSRYGHHDLLQACSFRAGFQTGIGFTMKEPKNQRSWQGRQKNVPRIQRLKDVGRHLPNIVFSVGFFYLLTGLIWVEQRGLYPRLLYWFVALPALLWVMVFPRETLGRLFKSPIFLVYLPLACYMAITLFWSENEDDALDIIKRPLFIALAFVFISEFGRRCHVLLTAIIKGAAVFSVFSGLGLLYFFFSSGGQGRLAGHGALSNPLLLSHVFGFFLALWLGYYFCKRKLIEPLFFFAFVVLLGLIFATGSRTPLVGVVFTAVWLTALMANRKGLATLGVLAILTGAILLFSPEVITQRGVSYRNEIWRDAIEQILEKPWFGHGLGTPLQIRIEALNQTFADPHNLTLSVFYSGGLVGGILWITLYLTALKEAWRWRKDRWVAVFSATVVYGFAAGLTEGGAFLSRPKEHWFLIWIPMALLSWAVFTAKAEKSFAPADPGCLRFDGAQENTSS
jgi:O-antigen ligase